MYRTVVTICTASLTFNNSTFCTHSVFMCFVWIWEQTAIISLYSIDWLVFITETECVYCAVRSTFYVQPTQCIYVFCVDLRTNSNYFTGHTWQYDACALHARYLKLQTHTHNMYYLLLSHYTNGCTKQPNVTLHLHLLSFRYNRKEVRLLNLWVLAGYFH